ncbi:MAG: hypothetical protein JSS87_03890 [Acidobacteria bacterium]|nr:hypothetical protein [Acidobacteriota bacterium]
MERDGGSESADQRVSQSAFILLNLEEWNGQMDSLQRLLCEIISVSPFSQNLLLNMCVERLKFRIAGVLILTPYGLTSIADSTEGARVQ